MVASLWFMVFDLYLCCTLTREDLLNRNTSLNLSTTWGFLMSLQFSSQNKQYQTLQVIDNVLNQILGQEATQIIYKYLESTYHIQKHEIIEKLDSFNCALEEYLGAGATIIEKVIMQSLEIRVPEENKYFDLVKPPRRLEST
jgi:hypothetical protein